MPQVGIKRLPALRVVGIEHRGPYERIGRAFDELHAHLARGQARGPGEKLVAVYLDNAAATPPADLHALAGVASAMAADPPLKEALIEAGEYAVLRHAGPYAGLGGAYEWLFGEWLPRSGRQPDDRPCYEIYLNTPADAAPDDLVTEIHLPLRPAAP